MFTARHPSYQALTLTAAAYFASCLLSACGESDEEPARAPAGAATAQPAALQAQSWPVCTLLGPDAMTPGVYGSDLGITTPLPGPGGDAAQLAVLFGDTWAGNEAVCTYPVVKNDDLQATLPAARPAQLTVGAPGPGSAAACSTLQYPLEAPSAAAALPDPQQPAKFRRMRLFPDAGPRDEARMLDMSMLRTPAAAFSDGRTLYGIFVRQEHATCNDTTGCPGGMLCSTDPASAGERLGACAPHIGLTEDAAPVLCVRSTGCALPRSCEPLARGVCMLPQAFPGSSDAPAPSWYADDPRRSVAQVMYVASAFWPDRPEDYAVGARFVTNKFTNLATRTVANFDFAQPENNDYRPGQHSLLLWGRPAWLGQRGFQALMFLAAQPLAGLSDAQGGIRWAPKFFAGYGPDGQPQWSDSEADAVPVYGANDHARAPEHDYVVQFSTTWSNALQRWLMVYGGSVPAWLATDQATGEIAPVMHPQPVPGSLYVRSARHPWGRARSSAPASEAWSAPALLLDRSSMQPYLACDEDPARQLPCGVAPDSNRPTDLVNALGTFATPLSPEQAAGVGAMCLLGSAALDTQYNLADDSGGHLYGVNIIESWTEDVTGQLPDIAAGQRALELYLNVSTWNPYQVLLLKTQLRAAAP